MANTSFTTRMIVRVRPRAKGIAASWAQSIVVHAQERTQVDLSVMNDNCAKHRHIFITWRQNTQPNNTGLSVKTRHKWRHVHDRLPRSHLVQEHGDPVRLAGVARMLQQGNAGGVGRREQASSLGLILSLEERFGCQDIARPDAGK